jgi:hypothetical protein
MRSLSSGAQSRGPLASPEANSTSPRWGEVSRHPDTGPRSRGAICPSCANNFRPEIRGRREGRVRAAPAVSRAKCTNKNAHEHTGSAEAVRPSLRNGFTAYTALSPVTGLSCHRHRRDTSHRLDASVGAPGPHGFAVRIRHVSSNRAFASIASSPASVTIAIRPSVGWTAGVLDLICPTAPAEYFSLMGWTAECTAND